MIKPIAITCFLLFFTHLPAQSILFVNHAATGQQTGTSWSNALTNLRDALTLAQYGDQIWIAQGTYSPTTTTDRNISFQLKNGVSLYGGFNGSETSLDERNPTVYLTRLSGNIGDTTRSTDNSLHVIRGKGLDDKVIIDGLIISDGYSIGSFFPPTDPDGAGMYLTGSPDLADSRPVIQNCVFEKNYAANAGGALFMADVDPDDPFMQKNLINPVIINCTFKGNRALTQGGAILKQGATLNQDTFSLNTCKFIGNYILSNGGGAVYFSEIGSSIISMENCLFKSDSAFGGVGGAFFIIPTLPSNSVITLILRKCIFSDNMALMGGGFLIDNNYNEIPQNIINLTIDSCVFERNLTRSTDGSAFSVLQLKDGTVNAEIRNSLFRDNRVETLFTAAILCDDQSAANVLLENSTFYNNRNINPNATYGIAFSVGGKQNITTRINNCIFANNKTAVFSGGDEMAKVTTDITNCTFFRNGIRPFGKRWYPSFQQAGAMYYNNMHFKNCVIWEDLGNPSYMFNNNYPNNNNAFGFRMDYCSINISNPNVVANSNLVFGDSMIKGIYPMFLDTSNLNFRLDKCSVAINQGSNAAAADAGILTDLDGLPRVRFDTVDLGAYEQQTSCIVSTAMNPTLMQALLISPNPGTGNLLSFKLPDSVPASGHLRIYAANGAVVQEQMLSLEGNNQVSLPKLPPGCYNVMLSTGKTAFVGKWVVVD